MRNAEGGFQPMGERTSSGRPMGVFNQFASPAECGEKGKDIITPPEIVIMKKRSFRYHRFEFRKKSLFKFKIIDEPGPPSFIQFIFVLFGPTPRLLPSSLASTPPRMRHCRRITRAYAYGIWFQQPHPSQTPETLHHDWGVAYEIPVYRLPPPRKY
jgi:hypothetical protein